MFSITSIFSTIFHILFIVNTFLLQPSKSISPTPEVECTRASDCGANFTCNPFGECVCLFDFIEIDVPNSKSICLHLRCARNTTCHYHFGTASFCGPNRRCLCPSPLAVDPIDQKCHRLLGSVCQADTDCGGNAVCATGVINKEGDDKKNDKNHKNPPKTCICRSGTVGDALQLNCNTLVCNSDAECVEHFGDDYHCHKKSTNSSFSVENHCDCHGHRDYWINPQTQRCERRANACTQVGTVPVDFELLENATSSTQEVCKELVCDEDSDCSALFSHTICDEEQKRCRCSGSGFFELNKEGTSCVFKAILVITFGIVGVGLVAFGIGGACYWKWGGAY